MGRNEYDRTRQLRPVNTMKGPPPPKPRAGLTDFQIQEAARILDKASFDEVLKVLSIIGLDVSELRRRLGISNRASPQDATRFWLSTPEGQTQLDDEKRIAIRRRVAEFVESPGGTREIEKLKAEMLEELLVRDDDVRNRARRQAIDRAVDKWLNSDQGQEAFRIRCEERIRQSQNQRSAGTGRPQA